MPRLATGGPGASGPGRPSPHPSSRGGFPRPGDPAEKTGSSQKRPRVARGPSRGPEEASPPSCWAFMPKPEIAPMCGGRAQRDGGLGTDGGRTSRGARRQTGTRGNRNRQTGTQTQLPMMSALCCWRSLPESLVEGEAGSLHLRTQVLRIIAVWPWVNDILSEPQFLLCEME